MLSPIYCCEPELTAPDVKDNFASGLMQMVELLGRRKPVRLILDVSGSMLPWYSIMVAITEKLLRHPLLELWVAGDKLVRLTSVERDQLRRVIDRHGGADSSGLQNIAHALGDEPSTTFMISDFELNEAEGGQLGRLEMTRMDWQNVPLGDPLYYAVLMEMINSIQNV